MFDFRYHVVSLAAVFLALVIGMLVGAGISERGGLLRDVERDRLNNRIAGLEGQLEEANARTPEEEASSAVAERGWKALAANRLTGKRVGVLFVGRVDPDVRAAVNETVQAAGGTVSRMSAVTVPTPTLDVEAALRARRPLQGYVGVEHLQDLGRDLGRELVDGGETPLWDALSDVIVEERSGSADDPVDAIVVSRNTLPQPGETGRFLNGLYSGVVGAAEAAVGVERSRAEVSAVKAYRRAGMSSVDDVELPAGRVALAILLAGGPQGSYGIKDTSSRRVPAITPVAPIPVP